MRSHVILFVADQARAASFYTYVLGTAPTLDVPGMTEFALGEECVLGLMPERGIKRLLGDALPDPPFGRGMPRAEIYLVVNDPDAFRRRALETGAVELSGFELRDWGHRVAYVLDPDDYVLAFAEIPSER